MTGRPRPRPDKVAQLATDPRLLAALAAGDDGYWRDDAACSPGRSQVGPEAFFPDAKGSASVAVAECRGCDVWAQCLRWALARGRDCSGVWGGTSEATRAAMLPTWRHEQTRRRRDGGSS